MDVINIKKRLNEIKEISDLREQKYFSWIRNIVTISTALLGILISLKPDKIENSNAAIFFIITISSLALGILFSLILLYSEIHILNKLRRAKLRYIQTMLDEGVKPLTIEWIGRGKFFQLAAFLSYSFYIISLFCLVIYSIFTVL